MESFESEVANYYKLEKKFLTTPFYPQPPVYPRFSPVWHRLKWKTVSVLEMILKGGKTCMKQSFLSAQWSDWDWISRKIILKSPIWLQEKLVDNFKGLRDNDLVTVVYNFVDMLSHKTEMDVVKELASDDKAYRSLTLSWFKNSPLWRLSNKHKN
jgi:hypothetical protein